MQTDWLVQQISQFARLLAVILGLKKREEYQAAQEAIEKALNTLLDLDLDKLRALPPAELVHRLTIAETTMVGREKVLFVAALLDQAGDIQAAQGQVEASSAFYVQALQLLLELILTDDHVSLPNYAPTVEDVLAKIAPETLPIETRITTMLYFEKIGDFGKAEDTLFEMLDSVADDPNATAELIAIGDIFYERLQQLDDEILIAGNFARDEIATGITDLRNYPDTQEE